MDSKDIEDLSLHDKALLEEIIKRFTEEEGGPPEQVIIDFSKNPQK